MSLRRNSTSGGNGNADAETVAMKQAKVQEMMVATAELASEREELGSGGRMIGRQVRREERREKRRAVVGR